MSKQVKAPAVETAFAPGFTPQRFTWLENPAEGGTRDGVLACWLDSYNGRQTLNLRRVWRNAQGLYSPSSKGVSLPLEAAGEHLNAALLLLQPEKAAAKPKAPAKRKANGTSHVDA